MTDNRFAQLKETFEKALPKQRTQVSSSRKKGWAKSPDNFNNKVRSNFTIDPVVRYEKLEELVAYHKAKSASAYLENLISKEWEKMQRKLKNKEK